MNLLEFQIKLRVAAAKCADQYFDIFMYGFRHNGETSIHNFLQKEIGITQEASEFFDENNETHRVYLSEIDQTIEGEKERRKAVRKLFIRDFKKTVGYQIIQKLEDEIDDEKATRDWIESSLKDYNLPEDQEFHDKDASNIAEHNATIARYEKSINKFKSRHESQES